MSSKRHFAEVDVESDDKKRFKVQNEKPGLPTPPPPPLPPTRLGPVPPPPKLGAVPPPPPPRSLGVVPPPIGVVPPPIRVVPPPIGVAPPPIGVVPPPVGGVPPPKLGVVPPPPPPSGVLPPSKPGPVPQVNPPPSPATSAGLPASKAPSFASGTKFALAPKKLLKAPNIAFQLGGVKKTPTAAAPLLQNRPSKVADVFNANDSSDEEEMPPEAKMKMRNVGRETITSSGPNSFGKTKIGFCDDKKLYERKLKETMDDVCDD